MVTNYQGETLREKEKRKKERKKLKEKRKRKEKGKKKQRKRTEASVGQSNGCCEGALKLKAGV